MQWPPKPGPGIEGLKAERLGLGGLDHFPNIDAHPVVQDLQLVDQGNVDRPVCVLEDLARFRHLGAGDGHDLDNDLAIEQRGELEAPRIETAHDLGNRAAPSPGVARVFALRAVGQEEVCSNVRPPASRMGSTTCGSSRDTSCSQGSRAARGVAVMRSSRRTPST